MRFTSCLNPSFSALVAVLAIATSFSAQVFAQLEENFSGQGVFSSNNGLPGFELADWHVHGVTGNFGNNGFGEDIFAVSTITNNSSQDGLFRLVGNQSFTVLSEFSNPVIAANGLSGFQMNVSDSPNMVGLSIVQNGADYRAVLGSVVGNDVGFHGNLLLGQNLDRISLMIQYEDDLVNGGGLFNAFVDVNESGNFMHVGTVDGSVYTPMASSGRTVFVGTSGFQNDAYVEIDRFSLNQNSIPEPATCFFATVCVVGFAARRRRRA